MIGRTLGHYRVVEKLGAGGMGEVYRSRDSRLERDVAIKVLPARALGDEAARSRFRKEALVLARLNHPHIGMIFDFNTQEGVDFLVMELVDGEALSAKLRSGPLPEKEISVLGVQVASALEEAHERGIVHRDLKPGNILITPKGQSKVLDFGLARLLRPGADADVTASLSEPHAVAGTVPYMAPEQLRGQAADARSDIWALGVVLYEMASGARPFQGETGFELSAAILNRTPPPLPAHVPASLRAAIERCLEKEPGRRYQRAGEVRAALEAIQSGTAGPWTALQYHFLRRRWLTVAGMGIVLLALLVALNFDLIRSHFAGHGSQIESLAVLPLVNASADPEVDYLADGITESLINSLSQLPDLAVMSRNSVFRYKGRETDAQAAGQTLKVQAVLTGRVLQRGDNLSISAELIEVRNNRHLWGEQYNRKLKDILTVQEEISTEISERLRSTLTGEEKKRLTKRYTQSTEAYQLYLKGLFYRNKRTAEGFNKGIEYFQKVIETDPNYAPAYASLADTYTNQANYNFALVPPREAWGKAKAAASKALQIDDTLATAHAWLALGAYFFEWDWPGAEKEFKRSLELDPSSSSTLHWYAHFLMTMGRTEESFRAGRRALEVDPLDLANNAHQGWHYLFIRQYDRAIEPLQKTIEMERDWPVSHWYLGLAYEQQRMSKEAIAEFEWAVRVTQGSPSMVALLGHAYAAANRKGEAQAILQRLSALSKQRYVPPYPIAAIHAALGQKDEAFAWLQRAYDMRDSWMDYLGLDPRFDVLRADPRFADLLRRMNLKP